jgi:hypothetical protein
VQGLAGSLNAGASVIGLLAGGLLFGIIGSSLFLLAAALTMFVAILSFWWAGRSHRLQRARAAV